MLPRDVVERAQGNWRGILIALGVDEKFLSNRHGPCPMCGGRDRFRFDNKDGRGSWICSQCEAGDGFTLLDRLKGWDFKEACKEVAAVLGGEIQLKRDPARREPTEPELKAERRTLWMATTPVVRDDPVGVYLAGRGFEPAVYPPDLRTCLKCPISEVPGLRVMNAMIALVRDAGGKPTTLHRTYIRNGRKADIETPKKTARGKYAAGSAVRLLPWRPGEHLGIAEGIETALGAAAIFEHPVWSGLDAGNMEKFSPPAGLTRLTIYGDSDTSFRGQRAAYTLANRLRQADDTKHIEIDVMLSVPTGKDFADEWLARQQRGEAA